MKGATRIFSRVWKTFLQISIHAPVKGATLFRVPARLRRCSISIHAPVKGATIDCLAISQISIDFNPRTREGCDTLVWRLPHPSILNFNPRTREGCDAAIKCSRLNNFMISIHAPVKGATCCQAGYCNHLHRHFNPRTREGCDTHKGLRQLRKCIISIHAPVKGATADSITTISVFQDFNPRTREGCDPVGYVEIDQFRKFQSTHP